MPSKRRREERSKEDEQHREGKKNLIVFWFVFVCNYWNNHVCFFAFLHTAFYKSKQVFKLTTLSPPLGLYPLI